VDTEATGPRDLAIELWFDFASNYSYLSVMRIEDAAERLGVRIVWRPFLLGPIFRALGMETSPFVAQQQKGAYVQSDMARLCQKYGLAPWAKPSAFPRSSLLPARIALVAARKPWVGAFCRSVMELNFSRDEEIDSPEQMTAVLAELGLSPEPLITEAQSEPVKARLRAQTEVARVRGVFGAPTFFIGQEMFWGDDRLDMALSYAHALQGRAVEPGSRRSAGAPPR